MVAAGACKPRHFVRPAVSIAEGDKFQAEAAAICESLGYQVIPPIKKNNRGWDLLVNGKKVQVKKRSIDTTNPHRVRLVTNLSASVEICTVTEVDAFAIHWRGNWYVFPSSAIADYRGVVKNRVLMRTVGHYRDCWSVLKGDRMDHDSQGFLFDL